MPIVRLVSWLKVVLPRRLPTRRWPQAVAYWRSRRFYSREGCHGFSPYSQLKPAVRMRKQATEHDCFNCQETLYGSWGILSTKIPSHPFAESQVSAGKTRFLPVAGLTTYDTMI